MAAMFQVYVFWAVTPCSVVVGYQRFRSPCYIEGAGSMNIRNFGILLQHYTVSQPRKHRLEVNIVLKQHTHWGDIALLSILCIYIWTGVMFLLHSWKHTHLTRCQSKSQLQISREFNYQPKVVMEHKISITRVTARMKRISTQINLVPNIANKVSPIIYILKTIKHISFI